MTNIEVARRSLRRKLGAKKATLSSAGRALIDYLLEEATSERFYIKVLCCSDGTLVVCESQNGGWHQLPTTRDELIRYLLRLSHAARLSPRERSLLLSRIPPPPNGAT